jgi:enoyl-CoA hydratase
MTYQTLLFEKENGIGTVTINRPQAANAMNDQAYSELLQLLQAIETDDEVRVVIITGAGEKAFVAGTDITNMAKLSAAEARAFAYKLKKTFDLIWNMDKPIIAAVNGYAQIGRAHV